MYAGGEGVGVKPAIWTPIGNADLLPGQARTFIDTVIVLGVRALLDVKRVSTGQCNDALEGPPGNERARRPLPTPGERNVPDVTNHQKVALVEQAAGAFGLDVSGILTLATSIVRSISGIIDEV